MAVWVVRAGRKGEYERIAFGEGLVVMGWDLGDLSDVHSFEEMKERCRARDPECSNISIGIDAGQNWAFVGKMQVGDIVVLPRKGRNSLAIGRVTGGYEHRDDLPMEAQETRPVEWLSTDVPRSRFDKSALGVLNRPPTVFEVHTQGADSAVMNVLRQLDGSRRHEAERRP